jgi:hypothetical protein
MGVGSADTFDTGEKVEAWFQAGGALAVGVGVQPDQLAASTGRKVITCTTALDHNLCGIFEGAGFPTGAKNTTSGLGRDPNRAAATGDVVLITVYGSAVGILDTVAAATAGDPLKISTATNGYLMATATSSVWAGLVSPLILCGTASNAATATATGTSTCSVWARFL